MTIERYLDIETGVPGGLNELFLRAFVRKTSEELFDNINKSKHQGKRYRIVVLLQEIGQ